MAYYAENVTVDQAFDTAERRPAPAKRRTPVLIAKRMDQELAFSTVTARRFCDQHEMSLQTATGRSLP